MYKKMVYWLQNGEYSPNYVRITIQAPNEVKFQKKIWKITKNSHGIFLHI